MNWKRIKDQYPPAVTNVLLRSQDLMHHAVGYYFMIGDSVYWRPSSVDGIDVGFTFTPYEWKFL